MKPFWIFDFGFWIGRAGRPNIFRLALGALLVALCLPAEAQQRTKIFKIGYLSNTNPAAEAARSEAIRLALRELGYVEGQNITTEYRYTKGKLDLLPELAGELVRFKPDVIVVAGGPTWIRAAKNSTKTIPIIMLGLGADPVEAGFVESLARPGGNVTGITTLTGELAGKRLELLKEAVPTLERVAGLYDSANPATVIEAKEVLQVAARALGLTVRYWDVRVADDFERVFSEISK